jgi:hypothetical protein
MVIGENNVGGLVGYNNYGSNIDNTYAIGMVSGRDNVGGLVGFNDGAVSDSFWDMTTSGTNIGISSYGISGTSEDVYGLETPDMMTLTTFTNVGWSIDDAGGTGLTWRIYDGWSYPLLRDFLTPLSVSTVDGGNDSKTYDGNPYYLFNAVYNPADAETSPNVFCVLTYGAAEGAVNAGTYALTLGGLYSNQVGYDITFGSGELTVNPAVINLTGTRIYDGTTVFNPAAFGTGGTIDTGIGTETLVLTGSGSVASKNVSAGVQTLNLDTLTLNDGTGLASNYTFVGGVPTGTITPLAIIGGITAADKDYDGTTAATITGYSLQGVIGADIVSYTGGTATFSDANAGSNKTVTATGLYLTGADAGNYTVNDTAFTTASIIGPPPDYMTLLQYGLLIGGGSTLGGFYLGSFVQWPGPVWPIINGPHQEGMFPPSFQLASYMIPHPVVEGVTVEIVRSWQSPKDKTKGSEGLIVVEISESLAQPGSFFTFTLPAIIADQIDDYGYSVKLKLADGSPLPAWLQYDNASKTFTAVNVPEGYLPVTILLDFGGQIWKIELKQQE